jgi:hypothetical protein
LGLPLALAACFSAALLLSSLSTSGLAEPFELDAADRARRFAADALHAHAHALATGATPPAPPSEVPGGPLPRALVALGFAVFGLRASSIAARPRTA